MATERRVYPSINALRDFVQTELKKRKKGNLAVPTPTITPFVRMTSAMEDAEENYRFFSIGLHGITDTELEGNIFDLTYGDKDVVGFAYDTPGFTTEIVLAPTPGVTGIPLGVLPVPVTTRNGAEEGTRFRRRPIQSTQSPETKGEIPSEGKHPVPGITNVSVNYKGINDVINVEVSWKCYNATQLNFLRNHFLLAGQYVVVDFGHIISNRTNTEPLRPFDYAAGNAIVKLAQYEYGGRLAVVDGAGDLDPLVEQNGGNYDIFIGKVIDSAISLQPDNTYDCKTTIVSTGEVIYGATHHSLIADLAKFLTEEDKNEYLATLEEFFKDGGELDALIGMAAAANQLQGEKDVVGQPGVVDAYQRKRTRSGRQVETREGPVTIPGSKIAADQFVYISWNFFTHNVIPQMFQLFEQQRVNSEINLFTTIGQPVIDIAIEKNERAGESVIGNHPILTSVDHKTLIIVKEESLNLDVENNDAPALFAEAKIFSDENNDTKKGYLSRGVYLNVEAIKESFINQRTFYDGMAALLRRMNNATANYWKLDIGFDEESKKVYIFDRGCVLPDFPDIPTTYIFNEGVEGELLGLDFNASYTDEVKTSIMISGRTKGRGSYSGGTVAAAPSEYGVTFGPDRHGVIVNTNSLEDVLQTEVNKIAKEKRRTQLALLGKTPETERVHAIQTRDVAHDPALQEPSAGEEEVRDIDKQLKKYTNELEWYLQLPSTMKGRIAAYGITHSELPNNYLSPIATEISCEITVMGLSGIAFWDCFMVDKLPKVYREHGVFLVNGLSHNVSRDGWTTTIRGLYYFIWMDGQQGQRIQAAQKPKEGTFEGPVLLPRERELAEERRRERRQGRYGTAEQRLRIQANIVAPGSSIHQ